MVIFIIFTLLAFGYTIFFFIDRKRALLFLFLIKLPLDQITWKYSISVAFITLRTSEALTVFITLLLFMFFLLDKTRDPYRRGFFRNIPSVLFIPIIIFMLVFSLNVFRGGWWFLTAQQFMKLTTGILVGTFVAATLKTEDEIKWLLRCMLFGTAIISILNIPAIYSGGELHVYAPSTGDKLSGTAVGGGVGSYYAADSFSHAFIPYIPAILFASVVLKSKVEKLLCFFVVLFSILAVFVAAIRAGWISLSLILIFWMVVRKQWKLIILSTACIFIIATAQLFSSTLNKAYQKISLEADSLEKGELPDYAFSGRPRIWKTYLTNYMAGTFVSKLIGNDTVLYESAWEAGHDPHNDFIYILVRMGIIGLSATLLLYIWTLVYLFKAIINMEEYFNRNLALTAILALIGMMVPALTRAGLMNPNYEWVFWTFTMITMKKYMLTQSDVYQSENSLDTDEDEDSESIAPEITEKDNIK